MSILFSQWKEEQSSTEKFNEIMNVESDAKNNQEVTKEIEKALDNNYTSKQERIKLLDLYQSINNQ